MKEGKMSRSLGNVAYLKNLVEKGYSAMDYRYMCLTTHYRSELQFFDDNLDAAKNAYARLKNICAELADDGKVNEEYISEFKKALEDDIDMPKALAVLWKLVRDKDAEGKYQTIAKMDSVFGLRLLEKEKIEVPAEVKKLAKERFEAKKKKDFKKADELREKINKLGFAVNDKPDGYEVKKL